VIVPLAIALSIVAGQAASILAAVRPGTNLLSTEQIAERWAEFLEPGLIDHVALQLPAGDMTFDEARHTLELFAAEVKPRLEQASLAV
jgi:lysophospholipase L1-like esterase